jgi:hypothetical protein
MDPMTARHAALSVLLLAATAASADEVVKTHEDPTFDGTAAKILVVGVHADNNVRTMFENGMARALREAGTVAEPSIGRMGSAQELTAETLVAAAVRADADAVLVARAVDAEAQNASATTTFVEYFRAYASDQDPLPVTTTHTVRVRADLYIVASQARVWGAESTAIEKHNLFGVIDGIATAVTAQLRADGLIR